MRLWTVPNHHLRPMPDWKTRKSSLPSASDLLRKIDFFNSLDEKNLHRIALLCEERHFADGDYLAKQGEPGLGLFFLLDGRAIVELDRDGIRSQVAELLPEQYFGELAIIDEMPRPASVLCSGATRCLVLPRASFIKLMNRVPSISMHVAKILSMRVRAANDRLAEVQSTTRETPLSGPETSRHEAGEAGPEIREGEPLDSASERSGFGPKNQVRDMLLKGFDSLYTMKALTRFTAAVIGCPVDIRQDSDGAEPCIEEINGVKVALFPADEGQALAIDAYGSGYYSAVILRPSPGLCHPRIETFHGSIREGDRLRLHVPPGGEAWLESVIRKVPEDRKE